MPSLISRRTRLAGALTAFLAAGAFTAANAHATTYCVLDSSCSGTMVADLQTALDLAKTAGDDRIELGPATFERAGGFSFAGAATSGSLAIVGAGAQTLIAADTPAKSGSYTVLDLQGGATAKVTVRALRVRVPARADAAAQTLGLTLEQASGEDLIVDQEAGALGAYAGVRIRAGGLLRASSVTARDTPDTAAVALAGAGARLEDATISGGSTAVAAYQSAATVARVRASASGAGTAIGCSGCHLSIDDSLLRVDGSATGLRAEGVYYGPAEVDASNLTIAGRGGDGTTAVAATANPAPYASATLRIDNSILHAVGRTLVSASPAEAYGPLATVAAVNDNYAPGRTLKTGAGGLTQVQQTSADPRFVDEARGDLRLSGKSWLLDRGRVTGRFVATPLALGGRPRVVDGDWSPGAAPDLGAFEYQAAPPVALIDGATAVPAGVPVTFDGSRSFDTDPGEIVSHHWSVQFQDPVAAPQFTHVFAPGATNLTLSVVDPSGRTTRRTVTVTARWTGAEPPLIASARIAPRRLRRGRAGSVALKLARDAIVDVKVRRRRSGGRWGGRRGMGTRPLEAGDARFPLDARLTDRLKPGRYRATIVARGDRESRSVDARFRVLPRKRQRAGSAG